MKIDIPGRVYEDFVCFNQPQIDLKVFYKQIPIAAGYYPILLTLSKILLILRRTGCIKVCK